MKTQHLMKGLLQLKRSSRSNDGRSKLRTSRWELRKELEFWEQNMENILVYRKTSLPIPQSKSVKVLLENLHRNRDYYAISCRVKTLRKHLEVSSGVIDLYNSAIESPLSLMGSVISIISFLADLI